MSLSDLRQNYTHGVLDESTVDPDPFVQFERWFDEARNGGVPEPNAMTLATATRDGVPSARIVLLKGLDERGFIFYTNYESRKGRELADNPHAALVFYWPQIERQVRATGTVERISRDESAAYFHSRPRGSQLGAWASQQSRPIASRAALDDQLSALAAAYGDGEIPLPPFWGGLRLTPWEIEFWQGRPNRLHDRILYMRADSAGQETTTGQGWRIVRLSP